MPLIRSSRILYKWLLSVVFGAWFSSCRYSVEVSSSPQTGHTTLNSTLYRQLENQAPNTTDSKHLYNTLELLMMGIKVPETCWASNKICNKNSYVASSWHFYLHIISTMHGQTTSNLNPHSIRWTTPVSRNRITYRTVQVGTTKLKRVIVWSIIPPMLHTHLHLHAALTRRTNGQSLGTFVKTKLCRISRSAG
jgi:hypothetical protein